jgi:hypothetical protein
VIDAPTKYALTQKTAGGRMKILEGWDNFYVILGSAAAGLIGLTFVVIALVSDAPRAHPAGMQGYIKPTIVHFGTVFALSAYMSIPHQTIVSLSAGLAICGTGGVVYAAVIANGLHRFAAQYVPVVEDWVWHVILPTLDYAMLLGVGCLIWYRMQLALYCVAAALTLLLFIGIHNAFDVAVSVTAQKQKDNSQQARQVSKTN